jgi:hypothetical protein
LRWTESAIEAVLLGAFMVSALGATALLEYPASPVRMALQNATARRAIAAVAMAVTAAAIIYSPWGRRSGDPHQPVADAHLSQAPQDRAARRGVVHPRAICRRGGRNRRRERALRGIAGSPEVNYAATVPGSAGIAARLPRKS